MHNFHTLALFFLLNGVSIAAFAGGDTMNAAPLYSPDLQPETAIYFYHSPQGTSPMAITDGAGQVTQRLEYFPYGSILSEESTIDPRQGADVGYRFNGKNKDDATGYTDFGARMYSDREGTWLRPDPWEGDPQWSKYVAFRDNPISYADPNGKNPIAIGAAVGGGIGLLAYLYKHRGQPFNKRAFGWELTKGVFLGGITGGVGSIELTLGEQVAVMATANGAVNVLEREQEGTPPDYVEDYANGLSSALLGLALQNGLGRLGSAAFRKSNTEGSGRFAFLLFKFLNESDVEVDPKSYGAKLFHFVLENVEDEITFPEQVTQHEFAVAATEFLRHMRVVRSSFRNIKLIGNTARKVIEPFLSEDGTWWGAFVDSHGRKVYVSLMDVKGAD
jgi:RHS repeat-associated protein